MKCFVTEALIIFLLCFMELFKVASSDQRSMDIIDNFIGLAEPNNNEIAKRNSIVDGGVFVPYKSTTIVYKSRLVPVTYGFVIKKETLKDNPALYKLGVKLLDEKVESTPKKIQLDEKTIEPAKSLIENQSKLNEQLDAKSNCVKGSKVLRLLAKLSKDINKIEKAILAQNQSVESESDELIAKSLKKTKERQKLHPQNEAHVSGHKGLFEKDLNILNKKPQKQYISKNLSRYWHCRRSHTKKKCAMFLLTKHAQSGQHHGGRHPAKHETSHHNKHRREHYKKHERHKSHARQHLNKHNNESIKNLNKHASHDNVDKYINVNTKYPAKQNKTKHRVRHEKDRLNHDKHNKESIQNRNNNISHDNVTKYINVTTKHAAKHNRTKHRVRHERDRENHDKHNHERRIHPARHKPKQKHHRKHLRAITQSNYSDMRAMRENS